ncbi:hypothetical protein PACTADRAFT_20457, partial [Pachysolen tannophilus NRRL Y-2460]
HIPPELLDRLQTFSLFKNAPPVFLKLIAKRLKLIQFHPQEYILREGEPSKSMYWILRGTVGVTSADGEATSAELGPESFFGEIGIMFNRPRTATVVARTRVLLGVLTADALNEVLPDFPLIERLIRDEAQERLAMLEKKKRAGLASLSSLNRNNSSGKFSSNLSAVNASLAANTVTSFPDFLKSLPIFKSLPSSIIHELALDVELKKFNAFEYIFKKGDTGRDIFFIVDGEVEVVDPALDVPSILARLGPGKYFGEMAFLISLNENNSLETPHNSQRSADIRTVADTVLLVVTGDKLANICEKNPLIFNEIKKTAGERNQHNDFCIADKNSTVLSHPKLLKRIPVKALVDEEDSSEKSFPFNNICWNKISSEEGTTEMDPIEYSQHTPINHAQKVESVSPVSECHYTQSIFSSSGSSTSNTSIQSSNGNDKKRKSHSQLPLIKVNPTPPPINSISVGRFQRQPFHYMPIAKRLRLTNSNHSRRRSSVLTAGPLTDRIMLIVFSYLDLKTLMKVRRVCSRWAHLLAASPDLVRNLDLTLWNTAITDNVLLHITDFVGDRPQHIDISNCFHITDVGFSYMVNEIGIRGNLKSLKMKSAWKISSMAIMDLSFPSVGQHLEEINLTNCRNVNDDVFERLIGCPCDTDHQKQLHYKGPSRFPSLKPDNIYDDYFNSHNIGCANLKKMDLSYCKHMTDKSMAILAGRASDRIEELILTRCTTITDNGFHYWSLHQFPKLRKLVLKDCTFLSDNSIISIATSAPNLTYLDISFCCALTDSAIDFLCFCCKDLRYLNISFCGGAVSDISLISISRLQYLEILIIRSCLRVTREGIDRLLAGSGESLKLIDLAQCKNAHHYPFGGGPAEKWCPRSGSRSAFIKIEPFDRVIEIIL